MRGYVRKLWYWVWPSIAVVLGVCVLLCVPMWEAWQIGGDEGYELLKGKLWYEGAVMYKEIWNNMPPLHTWAIKTLFEIYGPQAGVARLLSTGLAVLLVLCCGWYVKQRSNNEGALVTVLALWGSPEYVTLAVSAMLELPAFAVAMAAVVILGRWGVSYRTRGQTGGSRTAAHLGSGIVAGLACEMKWSTIVVCCWCIAEIAVGVWVNRKQITRKGFIMGLVIGWGAWGCGWSIAVSACLLAFPGQELQLMFWEHTNARQVLAGEGLGMTGAQIGRAIFAWMPITLVMAIVSLRFAKMSRSEVPVVIYIGACVCAHMVHGVFWEYFMLHCTIGLAVWVGVRVGRWARLCEARESRRLFGIVYATACASMASVWLENVSDVRGVAYRSNTQWAMEPATRWEAAMLPIEIFHWNVEVDPWSAIMPRKRVQGREDMERWE